MNVFCPKCQALFRIDPERVPPAGARVRCARCADVFLLTREGAATAAPSRVRRKTSAQRAQRTRAPAGGTRSGSIRKSA